MLIKEFLIDKTVILQLKIITKKFGAKIIANNNVSLDVYKGEILSILGENGCGKTTLMNMVAGIYYPDSGKILINGEEVIIRSPRDAFEHKIGMIHQHFKLIDIFSAAQNVALGVEGEKFNLKEVNNRIKEMANKYGFNINLDKKIYEMSVSEKQTVEILKVLYRGADILILDEPTAVLTPQEIRSLFKILRAMRDDGKSIIIITHKLNEVMEISDRVTVLRKGDNIATVNTDETSEKELTEMMVGEKIDLNINRTEPVDRKLRLSVSGLTIKNSDAYNVLDNVSFDVYGGEILGIAGIAGSGQKELLEAIAGLNNYESGELIYYHPKKDKPVSFFHKTYRRVMELNGENAFKDCSGMTQVHIPNGVTSIEKGAFFGCTGLTSVILPDSVTSIAEDAFASCANLASIQIPDGVTTIGARAFRICRNLSVVDIPKTVSSIGDCAFFGCTSLSAITIPEGITSINHSVFSGCSNLTKVSLPHSVEFIQSDAFGDCKKLSDIAIPTNINSISYHAFRNCTFMHRRHKARLCIYCGGKLTFFGTGCKKCGMPVYSEKLGCYTDWC